MLTDGLGEEYPINPNPWTQNGVRLAPYVSNCYYSTKKYQYRLLWSFLLVISRLAWLAWPSDFSRSLSEERQLVGTCLGVKDRPEVM